MRLFEASTGFSRVFWGDYGTSRTQLFGASVAGADPDPGITAGAMPEAEGIEPDADTKGESALLKDGVEFCSPCMDPDEAEAVRSELSMDEAVPCLLCNMYLNGQQQYQDHLKGKRHRKLLRRQRRRGRGASGEAGVDASG